jgi:tRNA pseudouridine13 synthase
MNGGTHGSLRPGAEHFHVEELPAYAPGGAGEHLYVHIEKTGLTTDQAAQALARACGVGGMAVGFAGRKDRHGVTSQWFSVHIADEAGLARLAEQPGGDRLRVLAVGRHLNKLRPGHLIGNRFRLGIAWTDRAAATAAVAHLAAHGIPNRFGAQRFGVHGATLRLATAWGAGDVAAAVAWCVDPSGRWHPGDPLPDGFRPPPEGLVLGALRARPDDHARALARGGDTLRKLAASAAQAAICNAVLDARMAAGLLHRLRPGDVAMTRRGAPFVVAAADLDDLARRAAPGVLDVIATGPLPGVTRFGPSPAVLAEEQAWSAATGVDWSWFGADGTLRSPGDRRPLVTCFHEPPVIDDQGISFALPAGAYATEALAAAGISTPDRRAG